MAGKGVAVPIASRGEGLHPIAQGARLARAEISTIGLLQHPRITRPPFDFLSLSPRGRPGRRRPPPSSRLLVPDILATSRPYHLRDSSSVDRILTICTAQDWPV
ncbi:hypothetical protein GGTG_13582 [Gaeumannomyces tritici R3-111a-1]|uniref:Uncharacterized protein n=1 Tax=Gaeumannomyces tritici (strain R3-111a-1) TaxID=644352 RepID=J3PJA1_GAET3|nr:hypothetical protein GGTG_13582 [Gaeumannomyces tritici R3-111a-1]EJT68852.1 hypothetical protein GGTG_13582 [Gaeumannomyces tritici R3-111a-1]